MPEETAKDEAKKNPRKRQAYKILVELSTQKYSVLMHLILYFILFADSLFS